jgi:uncharacterized protein (UPF0335 family)
MMTPFHVFGVDEDVTDEELREAANEIFTALNAEGYDVDGVAPVLRDRDEDGGRDE